MASFPLRNCSLATCLSIYFPGHVIQSPYSYSYSWNFLEELQNATLCIQWCKEHSETFPETNELDSKPVCFRHTVIYSNFGAVIFERHTAKQIRTQRKYVCERHNLQMNNVLMFINIYRSFITIQILLLYSVISVSSSTVSPRVANCLPI